MISLSEGRLHIIFLTDMYLRLVVLIFLNTCIIIIIIIINLISSGSRSSSYEHDCSLKCTTRGPITN